jgi:phthiocerol/phenolphthiocerol synthesis type-I polyketide synthase E
MKTMNNAKYTGLEIAIVGMSGRFPGAKNIQEYWENIRDGKESIHYFSDEELRANGVDEFLINSPDYIKSSCVVENKDLFDSHFFNYTPQEAAIMDPQIRVFHECVWEALEDAFSVNKIKDIQVGLFAGASGNFDWRAHTMLNQNANEVDFFRASQLNDAHFISTLVSYKLNLKGPAVYVNTACSTSLVAVHMACRSLLTGDAKIAIAGGVAMNSAKGQGYLYRPEGILSGDGKCRAFNNGSSGTMVGQGAAVVVLKKLQDAIKDGDRIYSIIKGSAINNDGSRKVGYTAPSVDGQVECIRVAHKMAKVEPDSIGSIEAHGTGTRLGDPIEALALQKVFNNGKPFSAAISSVKSNIGHLDAAAGASGLIKMALSLWHKKIPAAVHSATSIPELGWEAGGFYLNKKTNDWERKDNLPLRGGVSSFGIGGTNAHIVMEEAPQAEISTQECGHKLLSISAKTEKSLKRYEAALLEHLSAEPEISLSDMCYTLHTGRKHFAYRRSLAFEDRETLMNALATAQDLQVVKSKERETVFMFSGAGSQYANMGRVLYDHIPFFKQEMDNGFALLKEMTGIDYLKIAFPSSEDDNKINEMLHTQPMIFLFGHSLARLLMSYGIRPAHMIGHSIGEYAAACISGIFSFEDALKLVVKRGELMNEMPAGAMLSVSVKEEEARKYLNDKLTIAAVNASEQIVFSGDVVSVEELINKLETDDIGYVKLYASHAGHSVMIDQIVDEYSAEFKNIKLNAPRIPLVSNLTGKEITAQEAASAEYWCRHMRETVKFSEGIKTLLDRSTEKIFIEIGGGHSLSSLLRQQKMAGPAPFAINMVRHPKEMQNDVAYLTDKLGQLWAQGVEIDWNLYYEKDARKKISLPLYSFEKIKYPAEVNIYEKGFSFGNKLNDPAGTELKDWIYYPVWKSSVLQTVAEIAPAKEFLVFSPENELNDSLKKHLLKNNGKVVEVLPANAYKKESAVLYYLDPSSVADFKLLFDDLEKDGISSTEIVYSWGIGLDASAIDWKNADASLSRLYFSLITMVKSLQQVSSSSGKRITVITDSLQSISGSENLSWHSSLLSGALNAMAQEYSINTLSVDLDLSDRTADRGQKIAAEILYNTSERYVAIRNGKRWLPGFEKQQAELAKGNAVITEGGTVLITGGAGNMGMLLAAHLQEKYKMKLALLGRREPDEELLIKLSTLRKSGNEAFYYSGDVSERESLKNAISAIEAKQGRITGIIHAAGITDMDHFELLDDVSIEKTLEMFAPKVQGIENIYECFKDKKPEFVWAISSLSGLLGGAGSASFAAAGLYMDHFISAKGNELPNWKSINLSETALSAGAQNIEKAAKRTALLPEELRALFDWNISTDASSRILVTVKELDQRLAEEYSPEKKKEINDNFDSAAVEKQERPNLTAAYVAPETETERKLTAMLEIFLGIDKIGIDDNFFELGGDSLKAMVLLKRVKKETGVSLTIKDFFTRPTVGKLAKEIDELIVLFTKKERTSKLVI